MRLSRTQLTWQIVLYTVLIVLAVIYIYPFLIQVFTSFKTDEDAASSGVNLLPESWTFAAYERLFANSDFPSWFVNSAIVTIFVTAGRVFFNSLAGYALARLRFRGRGVVFAALVAVMSVPTVVLLIPKFLVINQLGIFNSYAGMILLSAGRRRRRLHHEELLRVDPRLGRGAGADRRSRCVRTFWSVVLPMATPALITIVILSFQGSWNELSHFIVSTNDPALTTLTKGVASLASGQLSQGTQYPLKLAAALIMTIPVAVMFFIFQRRIMNSTEGAVKE